jgi:hypothetical protein
LGRFTWIASLGSLHLDRFTWIASLGSLHGGTGYQRQSEVALQLARGGMTKLIYGCPLDETPQ